MAAVDPGTKCIVANDLNRDAETCRNMVDATNPGTQTLADNAVNAAVDPNGNSQGLRMMAAFRLAAKGAEATFLASIKKYYVELVQELCEPFAKLKKANRRLKEKDEAIGRLQQEKDEADVKLQEKKVGLIQMMTEGFHDPSKRRRRNDNVPSFSSCENTPAWLSPKHHISPYQIPQPQTVTLDPHLSPPPMAAADPGTKCIVADDLNRDAETCRNMVDTIGATNPGTEILADNAVDPYGHSQGYRMLSAILFAGDAAEVSFRYNIEQYYVELVQKLCQPFAKLKEANRRLEEKDEAIGRLQQEKDEVNARLQKKDEDIERLREAKHEAMERLRKAKDEAMGRLQKEKDEANGRLQKEKDVLIQMMNEGFHNPSKRACAS